MYTFTTTGRAIDHADHIWEDWHAYLSAELPAHISRDATGICCHSCEVVVVDVVHRPTKHNGRTVCTCGDFNCASLDVRHAPGPWVVVSNSPLIVSAMCTCGDDSCSYTVSAHQAVNTHLEPNGYVKI